MFANNLYSKLENGFLLTINKFVTLQLSSEYVLKLFAGKIGSWKTHFDQKMLIQAEEYLISRLQGSDLAYPTFSTEDECSRLWYCDGNSLSPANNFDELAITSFVLVV